MKHKHMKIIAVLMIFIFTLTTVGCSKKPAAEELLSAADAKQKELTDMNMGMQMDMEIVQGENALGITMDIDMKMSGMNTEEMLYYMNTDMSIDMENFDDSINMITFYKDGYCYNETLGQKMKYPIDLNKMMKTIQENTVAANINSEFMTDLSLEEDGDNYKIGFKGNPDEMNEYIESIITSMQGMTGTEETSFSIIDISGNVMIDSDGYYIAEDMVMTFEMDVPAEGELPLTITANIHADFKDPGQNVDVPIPENLDEYIEIDPAILNGAL